MRLIVSIILICTVTTGLYLSKNSTNNGKDGCLAVFGKYRGHKYQSPGATVGEGKCLVESKWMKVMQHTVHPDGDEQTTIDDWLFIDYHDRINVLVEDIKKGDGAEKRFLVIRQTKYALEGRTSLAVVGGIIEPGEEAETAARREVHEELGGMVCNEFHFLGRFRTDVNRGMGWVNSFLAADCNKGVISEQEETYKWEEVGAEDSERQDIVSLTQSEIRESVKKGLFLEVQWSNTVALAVLHDMV